MTKINQFIKSRIGKSIERSKFYCNLSINLCFEHDKSVYFRSWGFYLLHNAIITTKTAKTHLSAGKAAIRHLILSTAAAIITHAKSYDLSMNAKSYDVSTMSILSVVRYFLLLNQLRAGDSFTSYSYGCHVGL